MELIEPIPILSVELTDEERDEQSKVRDELIRATGVDEEKARELRKQMIFPAHMLRMFKELMGAGFIREQGYDTRDADLVFGPGWLDEDDGGPFLDENCKARRIEPWVFRKHFLNKRVR